MESLLKHKLGNGFFSTILLTPFFGERGIHRDNGLAKLVPGPGTNYFAEAFSQNENRLDNYEQYLSLFKDSWVFLPSISNLIKANLFQSIHSYHIADL